MNRFVLVWRKNFYICINFSSSNRQISEKSSKSCDLRNQIKNFSWGKVQKPLKYFSKVLNFFKSAQTLVISRELKLFQYDGLMKSTKKPDKWKKHSFLINVLATFFGRNLSSSDFSFLQVTSVEKREPRKHFSASACSFLSLSLKKLFLSSL